MDDRGAVTIRPARPDDAAEVWRVLEPTIRAGETLVLPRDMTEPAAIAYWMAPERDVFVAETGGRVVGTFYVAANQPGAGAHVCNAGYVTAVDATGRGVARAMGQHSLRHARWRGFRAMQFNIVVSTNERAVRLWRSLGFEAVGVLPGAFAHPTLGYVDALVMFQTL